MSTRQVRGGYGSPDVVSVAPAELVVQHGPVRVPVLRGELERRHLRAVGGDDRGLGGALLRAERGHGERERGLVERH
ncbi:MAG TPA: hypothetical protein VLX31_10825 [Streptosporangiaceae bacterium]|nr:hypothetical protein [Streptosporangiaceae bacterium]